MNIEKTSDVLKFGNLKEGDYFYCVDKYLGEGLMLKISPNASRPIDTFSTEQCDLIHGSDMDVISVPSDTVPAHKRIYERRENVLPV